MRQAITVQLAFGDIQSKEMRIFSYTTCAEAIVALHRVTSGDPANLIPLGALVWGGSDVDRAALDYALERWCFH